MFGLSNEMMLSIPRLFPIGLFVYSVLYMVLWYFKVSARKKMLPESTGWTIVLYVSLVFSIILNLAQALATAQHGIENTVPIAFYLHVYGALLIVAWCVIVYGIEYLMRIRKSFPNR